MSLNGKPNGYVMAEYFTWDEIRQHRSSSDKWIVIEDHVYDISRFARKHPGGARIISHFAGQDATDVWKAMHIDPVYASKFMKPLLVGQVKDGALCHKETVEMDADFRELQQRVEAAGMYHVSFAFFAAHLVHIILMEAAALLLLACYGGALWLPWLATALILTTSQIQAGWSQHDYGHLSVFRNSSLNHLAHLFVIGHLKGASSHWWNFRHNQHHVKPNVMGADPDIATSQLFVLGDAAATRWGRTGHAPMPYHWQHAYFWIIGPPILLPLYFHLENIYFVFKRQDWWDVLWIVSFFTRFFYCYTPLLGGAWKAFGLYMFVRLLESFWFVFVTQSNHIPMRIDDDKEESWFEAQTAATCNIEGSWFNDWFTGHLNYQMEHHFFPTMPRHNYAKVAPLVRALCEKHHKPYIVKPMFTAFADILRSLKKSGQLWYKAYHLH